MRARGPGVLPASVARSGDADELRRMIGRTRVLEHMEPTLFSIEVVR
jgi:hypothetical protein